jgi:hypothetical protein
LQQLRGTQDDVNAYCSSKRIILKMPLLFCTMQG